MNGCLYLFIYVHIAGTEPVGEPEDSGEEKTWLCCTY